MPNTPCSPLSSPPSEMVVLARSIPDVLNLASSIAQKVGEAALTRPVVPGSAFGSQGEGYVRVSLCIDPDVLREGVERLAGAITEGER